jgi:capsular polysaccharide biosynthesis protein
MKKTTKFLLLVITLCSLAACQSQSVSINDPKLKSMIDSIVRVRVDKEVQATMHQYILQQQAYPSNYRKIAREEGERAAGRAVQEHESEEDAPYRSGY